MHGKLYLGAPPEHPWPLSLPTVETYLRQRFPDMIASRRTSLVTGNDVLDFDVRLDDGQQRHGTYVAGGKLALSDGTPADWADTIAWFLSLLPEGTPTMVMRDDGPEPVPLPEQTRTPEALIAFFESID
ncbi:hypothetical protein [Actinoplanes sp. NPDC049681]|uniref:hypothetical protein n=1 Tax=Actinoplanes sp. NPDC049681 TaxID=3363905 RepID=UPI00378B0962